MTQVIRFPVQASQREPILGLQIPRCDFCLANIPTMGLELTTARGEAMSLDLEATTTSPRLYVTRTPTEKVRDLQLFLGYLFRHPR